MHSPVTLSSSISSSPTLSEDDMEITNLFSTEKEVNDKNCNIMGKNVTFTQVRIKIGIIITLFIYYIFVPFLEQRSLSKELFKMKLNLETMKSRKDRTSIDLKNTRNNLLSLQKRIQSIEGSVKIQVLESQSVKDFLKTNNPVSNECDSIQGGQVSNTLTAKTEDESLMIGQIAEMEEELKRRKYQQIIQKYGEGPHEIEFIVILPSSLDDEGLMEERQDSFIVRLMPAEEMPVSVAYFLEMVDKHLWDRTALVHHRQHKSHVLESFPIDLGTAEPVISRFQEESLDRLPFPEQQKNQHDTNHDLTSVCDHSKYTIGFSGRVKIGPNFYINLEDNLSKHGPNEQSHHVLHEEGEPCFGVILPGHGRDVIDRIAGLNNHDSSSINALGDDSSNDDNIPSRKRNIEIAGILSARII